MHGGGYPDVNCPEQGEAGRALVFGDEKPGHDGDEEKSRLRIEHVGPEASPKQPGAVVPERGLGRRGLSLLGPAFVSEPDQKAYAGPAEKLIRPWDASDQRSDPQGRGDGVCG